MERTVSVAALADPVEIEELLQLFEQVAAEEGWQPGSALRAYASSARYVAAYQGDFLAGGVQVVLSGAAGNLPYQAVWPEVEVTTPCRTAHITVLALQTPFRGRPGIFWALCAELWRFLVAQDMEAVLLEATPHMLTRYRRLGFPLEEIGSLRRHWGEDLCLLCRMDLRTVAGAMLVQARRSPIYRTLVTRAGRSQRHHPCAPPTPLP